MKKIITLKANDSVFEHSEKPKELKNLLNEIEFQAEEIRLGMHQIRDLLYSVLACSRMDYYIDTDFDSFCDDFGYDKHEESTKELHYKCLKQSLLLKEILSEDEIEYLPN